LFDGASHLPESQGSTALGRQRQKTSDLPLAAGPVGSQGEGLNQADLPQPAQGSNFIWARDSQWSATLGKQSQEL
jgi:hypothetical protein